MTEPERMSGEHPTAEQRVLAILTETPRTVAQVASSLGLSEKATRVVLHRLLRAKRARSEKLKGHGGPWGYAVPIAAEQQP